MLAKRIIPCLDLKDGKVVKGVNFLNLQDVGDPVACAQEYDRQGADELVLLDITATNQKRRTLWDVVRKISKNVFMPVTVGGGIASLEDFQEALRAGADKVAVNSAAVGNPQLIADAAQRFGSQCVVLAIDALMENDGHYHVVINGGRIDTGLDAVEWAKKGEQLGAGEILLTSMDADGTKNGFDIPMLKAITEAVNIPVIASGGGGALEHFTRLFRETNASAALAASLFHFKELTVQEVKEFLNADGIPVRPAEKSDTKLEASELCQLFEKSDLVPAIVFEKNTKTVLMLAYMNKESLKKTLETGYTWFWSRSRGELWNKGATSGHLQKVSSMYADCDSDTILVNVEQVGNACHTGEYSCFFRKIL